MGNVKRKCRICGNVDGFRGETITQRCRGFQRAEKTNKVGNLKEVASISRESDCVTCRIYPGASAVGSACDQTGKTREGL